MKCSKCQKEELKESDCIKHNEKYYCYDCGMEVTRNDNKRDSANQEKKETTQDDGKEICVFCHKKGYIVKGQANTICTECFAKDEREKAEIEEMKARESKEGVDKSVFTDEIKQGSNPLNTEVAFCMQCNNQILEAKISNSRGVFCFECGMSQPEEKKEETMESTEVHIPILKDPKYTKFLVFGLYEHPLPEDEEEDWVPVTANYIYMEKDNPSQLQFGELMYYQVTVPSYVSPFFASVAEISGSQFVVSGGLIGTGPTEFQSSNAVFAVGVNKLMSTFNTLPLPKLTYSRYAHASVILGDEIYIIGGIQKNKGSNSLAWIRSCEKLNIFDLPEKLNLILNRSVQPELDYTAWHEVASLNRKRSNFSAFTYNDKIYVFGGFKGPDQVEDTIEMYTPQTDKWDIICLADPLEQIGYELMASSLVLKNDNDVYILGGFIHKESSDKVVKWDLTTNTFHQLPSLKERRSGSHGYIEDGKIYVFGGSINEFSIEVFDLKEGTEFKSYIPELKDADNGSGLLGRGFIGDYGMHIH
jgi:Uncharacterized protein conserved in bacteria